MLGIIMAGGTGSRLRPITRSVNKHLIPIYNKPLIYYPVSLLMLAGIRKIVIITNEIDVESYKNLLGNGSDWGIEIDYLCQKKANGIAEGIKIASGIIKNEAFCLVLGDNIFQGSGLSEKLKKAKDRANKGIATVFCYQVENPVSYGVACFDDQRSVTAIEEKPIKPKSNYAVTGLYFYPKEATKKVNLIKPSARGELEITDFNKLYMNEDKLYAELLGRGYTWMDAGTPNRIYEASTFVKILEENQGFMIANLEEIAFCNGWIDEEKLRKLAQRYKNTDYGLYIENLTEKNYDTGK